MNTNVTKTNALAWAVVLTSALFFFYEFIQLNLFNAISDNLMQDFQIDATELGHLSSMYFYANAIFLFPAGILLDRYSTKLLLLGAVVLSIVGTFLFGIAEQYVLAAIGRFMVGTGAAFCFLSSMRLASRWFPPTKMAFVTGFVVTLGMLGGLVAQTPFTLLSNAIGWRNAVLIDAGLGLVVAFIILLVVRDRPDTTTTPQKIAPQTFGFWRGLGLVLSNRYNWLGGIYTLLLNLPVFLLGALWGINYLVQVYHVTEMQASYATTAFFLGVIFGSPAFGWFSDHIGRRVMPMVLGAILSLIVILILMFMPGLTLPSLIFLFFLIGFVTSSQVLSYPTIAELNPPVLTGTAISVDSMLIMSSGAVFQPLFGWVMTWHWDHTVINNIPSYAPSDFFNAMLIMPIAFVIGLVAALLIRETYCKSQA